LWLAKLMVEGFNLFTWPSDGNLFFSKMRAVWIQLENERALLIQLFITN
jgi:hypothetical protein